MAVRMAVFHRNTGQYPQSTGIRYPPAQYGSPERQLFAPQVPAPQSTTAELTAPIDATDAWAPPTNEERFHGTTWQEPRNMTRYGFHLLPQCMCLKLTLYSILVIALAFVHSRAKIVYLAYYVVYYCVALDWLSF
ncbi:unnamed protein product [Didymodactylos carnosus]|uniref:Uncharacterized protein n=1 Tax=Didymodactylos carnosus TaxID=1234261 RepID=A0A8S2ZR16_9BILA|nr:unnamed protein product [Didymodactylos carnosus]